MSEQAIFNSIEQEILRNLTARHRKNGTINMHDVISEASFCLAVNNLISAKQLNQQSVPYEMMKILFTGMDKALEKHFNKDFKKEHSEMIKSIYDTIISNSNRKNMINEHYTELYGIQNGNVI